MGEFSNKTAIIPGGATKIGAAIARAFVEQGANVIIADINVTDGQALAQELGENAFSTCTSLREMKVPDSLQTFGEYVFLECSKLVPSDINVIDDNAVVAYLRSIQ